MREMDYSLEIPLLLHVQSSNFRTGSVFRRRASGESVSFSSFCICTVHAREGRTAGGQRDYCGVDNSTCGTIGCSLDPAIRRASRSADAEPIDERLKGEKATKRSMCDIERPATIPGCDGAWVLGYDLGKRRAVRVSRRASARMHQGPLTVSVPERQRP